MGQVDCLTNAMKNFGITTTQASESVREFAKYIPQFTDEDIALIKANPSLSLVAKHRIIKSMKKQMKGD